MLSPTQIILIGGYNDGDLKDGHILNSETNALSALPEAPVGMSFFCMPAPVYNKATKTVHAYTYEGDILSLNLDMNTWTHHGSYKIK